MNVLMQLVKLDATANAPSQGLANAPATAGEFAALLADLEAGALSAPAEDASSDAASGATSDTAAMAAAMNAAPPMTPPRTMVATNLGDIAMPIDGPAVSAPVEDAAPQTAPVPSSLSSELGEQTVTVSPAPELPALPKPAESTAETMPQTKPHAAPQVAHEVEPPTVIALKPDEATAGTVEITPTEPRQTPAQPHDVPLEVTPLVLQQAMSSAAMPKRSSATYNVKEHPARAKVESLPLVEVQTKANAETEPSIVRIESKAVVPKELAQAPDKPGDLLEELPALPAQKKAVEQKLAAPLRAQWAAFHAEAQLVQQERTPVATEVSAPESQVTPAISVEAPVRPSVEKAAVPVDAKPAAPLQLDHLGDQAIRSVRYLASGDDESITVRLIPDTLGELHLEIQHDREGITVKMISGNAAVRESLETQAHLLREALSRDGLNVQRIEVTPSPQANGGQTGGAPYRDPAQSAGQQHGQQPRFFGNTRGSESFYGVAPERHMPAQRQHGGSLNLFV